MKQLFELMKLNVIVLWKTRGAISLPWAVIAIILIALITLVVILLIAKKGGEQAGKLGTGISDLIRQ